MKQFNFCLYVAGESPNSDIARTNLEAFCAKLPADSYDIKIIDVLARPKLALAAEVMVTPTLDFQSGTVQRRIVGTLTDGDVLKAVMPKSVK